MKGVYRKYKLDMVFLEIMEKMNFLGETIGLTPLRKRIKEATIIFKGQKNIPKSRFGFSSLDLLKPSIGIPLWRGKFYLKEKVIIYNLFNHRQTPIEQGWSVKKTQVEDFRGKKMTYDSHNGTDFCVPIGTKVLASAPGKIVLIRSEFNRGGLKILIDHGLGIMTCSAHLARSLVKVGDFVKRGEVIAISGYSGFDGLITFPFGVPHVHYNVWLNCEPVDPFSYKNQKSLWRSGAQPIPYQKSDSDKDELFSPSQWDQNALKRVIESCLDNAVKKRLENIENEDIQAAETIMEMNYYPTLFKNKINIYNQKHERISVLDLPFSTEDFNGVAFLDDLA